MEKHDLIELATYLSNEYLEKEVRDNLINDLIVSLEEQNECIGKEFLHVLTKEKIKPFDKESSVRVKILAYNFGV